MNTENNNENTPQGNNPWLLVAMFAAIILVSNILFPTRMPATTQEDVVQESIVDTIFEKESEDSGMYKMDIISCSSSSDFTIRKIVNNSGHGDYELVAKMISGDYKILNVDENNINFFVLGDRSAQPYAIIKFTSGTGTTVSKADVYLPYEYTIETANKTDSISSSCDIIREESK